ncbi:DUF2007 domain-containing protein [Chryseobacterium sp. 09-1422]|jgi:hypothetical protein|uniref:DUF2007 domain-containing protein n=2 Tax=Chryseobacterium TaxID=59732 RepID=A0ABT3HTW1_9FLAO|nr:MULTISPECIES: DUF2007 domain-containing protein [Chryseobacterium]AYN02494.1 DUF2007 domain-containing protein [Chryseobacterium sp. 3008163]MCI3936220.1 DUF2007 domain-containing protein [Chryseobacterium aahli]MCU7616524.1 DUF2007 domain-containing protein [Chryseobacterium edaphi]MCW3167226.1 DUF2007 domain-containing protein [Chryseobacterium kimseyorum]UFH32555.1 DUF2007 domain-containing protein [Chryseobacterium sp. C-71]
MERNTRVSVFESDKPSEIQLIKSKLEDAQITNAVENNYLTFTTTPTATSLKVMVDLQDEKKAFDVIDAYLQQNQNQ